MRRQEALALASQAGSDYAERYGTPPDLQPVSSHQPKPLDPATVAEFRAYLQTWATNTKATAKAFFEAQAAADTNISGFGHSAVFVETAMALVVKQVERQLNLTRVAREPRPAGG